jgi:hypothetical protein
VLTVLAPGMWQERQDATELGDGIYSIKLKPSRAGAYYVSLNADWKKQKLVAPRSLMFRVSTAIE